MSDSNIKMVCRPDGVAGEGFFATKLNDVVGFGVLIHFGHCLLRLLVAELSLWLQWRLIMIWHVWI
jgi:hypothetical protein